MRTIDEIDSECAQAVLELGRKTYHAHLMKQEIAALNRQIFKLNAEALAVHKAKAEAEAATELEAATGAANE